MTSRAVPAEERALGEHGFGVPPGDRLTTIEKAGYGLGDLASNLFWQMFSIFIAKYYTDVFLLGAATMGTMLLVTRIADAFIDPMIGAIADRTHTRWGHFRPYLVWMALPMALTAIATFSVPVYSGTARVVYAYVTLTMMMVAYSAINIPYSALLGVLTASSAERTSASTWRFVMALVPVFVIVNTAMPLASHFGGRENAPAGWQMAMIIYSAAAVLLYLATFALTRERVQPGPDQKRTLREDLRDLFRNRPWVVLCAVGVAALTYANIRGTVAVYYFENVVPGGKAWFGPVMTTGAVAFIAGVMVTSPLARTFGKRNFYMASMALTAVLTIGFYFVPPADLVLVWVAHALISFVAAPTAPLVWAMYADTADYSEWRCGRRATGLIFSAASFAQKFGWAIGGAGAGWLLAYFGYHAGTAQSARTVNGIMLMMSVIPSVGALVALAALWFYELDEATVQTMGAELAMRRNRARTRAPELASAISKQSDMPIARDVPAVTLPVPMENTMNETSPASTAGDDRPATGMREGSTRVWRGAADGGAGPHGVAGARAGPVAAAPAAPLTPSQRAALDARFAEILRAGVHGLCFSPYREGQAPGAQVDAAQIRARLETIRPFTRWVRTFSATDGHEQTPRMAHELGMQTLVGAWLGTDAEINEREIRGVIEIAGAGHADMVAIGNEVLLREDLSEEALLGYLQRVRAALPGVPVGYVDAYYLFEQHPRVTAACDVILANCYPFWEGCPRAQALPYMQSMVQRVRAVAGGRPVVVTETGWPDQGSAFHGAVPSVEAAMHYFVDTMEWARRDAVDVFYFAAFDEPWKIGAEGDVGAFWGLWDKDGAPKFA